MITLLQDLESVIRLRLQLHERLPLQLLQKPYRIREQSTLFLRSFRIMGLIMICSIDDGRVTFTHPGCFKAAFTLGGDALSDQWYLVDFSFDFHGRDGMHASSGSLPDEN